MKKILVTGANSYIGKAFLQYVEKFPDAYRADSISLRDENWREADFSRYETVLHAAGLAHIKETEASRPLYYKINRDLAAETARKAKAEGVGQFIFLSSTGGKRESLRKTPFPGLRAVMENPSWRQSSCFRRCGQSLFVWRF